MKAKRLREGKIVEVEKHGDAMIDEDGKVMYFDEICEVDEPDWQQVRIQAAIAAMQGMLANPEHQKKQVESGEPFGYFYAMNAIMCADVLIAELKKGRNDE